MASSIFCDGVRRRDFIKVGALGGLGLHLAGYLRVEAWNGAENPGFIISDAALA